jgi:hypothetical protein
MVLLLFGTCMYNVGMRVGAQSANLRDLVDGSVRTTKDKLRRSDLSEGVEVVLRFDRSGSAGVHLLIHHVRGKKAWIVALELPLVKSLELRALEGGTVLRRPVVLPSV